MIASRRGHESVVRLLLDRGAQNATTNFRKKTALMVASEEGQGSVVRLLLDRGAQLDATDIDGNTAFMLASKNGRAGLQTEQDAAGSLEAHALNLGVLRRRMHVAEAALQGTTVVD